MLCFHLSLNEWINRQVDQSALHASIKVEQLINQLDIQKEYWSKLSGEDTSAVFVQQQLDLIKSQQHQLKKQLGTLSEQQLQVIKCHRSLIEKWQPSLDELKGSRSTPLQPNNLFLSGKIGVRKCDLKPLS